MRHVFQPLVMAATREIFGYVALARLPGGQGPAGHWEKVRRDNAAAPEGRHLAKLEMRSWSGAAREALLRGISGRRLFIKVLPEVVVEDEKARHMLGMLGRRLAARGLKIVPELVMAADTGLESIQQAVSFLREAGFARICLDKAVGDLRLMNSAMAMQTDYVKVDASMMEVMPRLGKAFIQAVQKWGSLVIAVRVENKAQEALALEAGVRCGQGYIWGQPN